MKHSPSPEFVAEALAHGLSEAEVARQWGRLQTDSEQTKPESPCILGSGIRRLEAGELTEFSRKGQGLNPNRAVRFVPASGAASRMFKAVIGRDPSALEQLNLRWDLFPFRQAAEAAAPCETEEQRWSAVVEVLDLPSLPKGALDFHVEDGGVRTAFDAQLIEWAQSLSQKGARIHFTLPVLGFEEHLQGIVKMAKSMGLVADASVQNPSTDTLAIGADHRPFLLENGAPLFRPGGHGSLIHNLSEIGKSSSRALVSIKNIDNVRPTSALGDVLPWRKALLGLADQLDHDRILALNALEVGEVQLAMAWLKNGPLHPMDRPPSDPESLREALDRPLLVAGMVRNEGEPGGGPFWVRDDQGKLRAQVVESAEMNMADPSTRDCVARATHFNPVDLVCAIHDASGQPYHLPEFIDARRDFVVSKSHRGRPLRALEHPGLWNGAMGRWNSVFVEVHSATFAPVKTVFDLLRPAHRA